jgi:murein DD-endopeptidase MepM/ murein hydrolase activator NlpD
VKHSSVLTQKWSTLHRLVGGILVALFVSSCAPLPVVATPQQPTAIPTSPSTVEIATETPAPGLTSQPIYEAPTLAPFPISGDDFAPDIIPASGFPPSIAAPLALSEHDHFYFSKPIANQDYWLLIPSQRYGVIQDAGELHNEHLGLDIGAHPATRVYAAAEGEVIWADYGLLYNSPNYIEDPYGIAVVIRHDFGLGGQRLYTIYAHLSETKVEKGDLVQRGDVIGLSGMTGLTTGPHLHFEVRLGGNTIYFTRNPELWITPPEGYGVLVGRVASKTDAVLLSRVIEVTNLDTGKKWTSYTYASEFKLLPDDYYQENFVLSDLPAGHYEIAIPYVSVWRRVEVDIKPGAITYFHFLGTEGYNFDLPAEPMPDFLPATANN